MFMVRPGLGLLIDVAFIRSVEITESTGTTQNRRKRDSVHGSPYRWFISGSEETQ